MEKALAIAGSQEKADIGFIQVDIVVRLFMDALISLRPEQRADRGAEPSSSSSASASEQDEEHDDLLADLADPKDSEPVPIDVGGVNDGSIRCLARYTPLK
jgi:hypothetical protein